MTSLHKTLADFNHSQIYKSAKCPLCKQNRKVKIERYIGPMEVCKNCSKHVILKTFIDQEKEIKKEIKKQKEMEEQKEIEKQKKEAEKETEEAWKNIFDMLTEGAETKNEKEKILIKICKEIEEDHNKGQQ